MYCYSLSYPKLLALHSLHIKEIPHHILFVSGLKCPEFIIENVTSSLIHQELKAYHQIGITNVMLNETSTNDDHPRVGGLHGHAVQPSQI